MLRGKEHLINRSNLDDLSRVHHRHAVRDIGDHAKVVGNVDDRHIELLLQFADQFQNLRLNGHIQRGSRLITDQDLRAAGHRGRNDDALAHTAGELMRILVVASFRVLDAHQLQHADRFFFRVRSAKSLMQLNCLLDLDADLAQGIQGGHRVLHHHGDFSAADFQPLFFCFVFGQIHSIVLNGTAGDRSVFVQHTDKTLGEHRLAGTGFAHDCQRLALIQVQRAFADGVELISAK